MAKAVKKTDTKTPKEASNLFHNIMAASMKEIPLQKPKVKKKAAKKK